jgi:hypothetical protein
VVGLTWALIAVHLLLVWPYVETVRYWRRYDPQAEVDAGAPFFETSVAALGFVFTAIYVVALVFWCMWVHRTYRNLPALGAEGLKYSPGWAVGYYFIPVFNLFRPFQVMRETSRASDPRHDGGTAWRTLAAPGLLSWWWALHLLSLAVALVSLSIGLRSDEPSAQLKVAWIDLGMLGVEVAVLLLEIRIIRGLTELQERRADAVGIPAAGAAAPTG